MLMEFVPGAPLSRDNYHSMQLPSVCAEGCTLPFGRAATPLEAIAPGYLADGRWRAANDHYRLAARR
jgi:NADH dehydrogenase